MIGEWDTKRELGIVLNESAYNISVHWISHGNNILISVSLEFAWEASSIAVENVDFTVREKTVIAEEREDGQAERENATNDK